MAIGVSSYYERAPIASQVTRIYTRVTGTFISASLDLKDQSTLRGANAPKAGPQSARRTLPRQHLDLTITLPFASEPGAYDLEILRDTSPPLVATSGQARIEHGDTLLGVKIDLSSLPPGEYQLGLRRAHLDWITYSVFLV